jgi:hypothetical protein
VTARHVAEIEVAFTELLSLFILDEREVAAPGRGPSGEDLILGIEGLRVGGLLDQAAGESVTRYVVGCLKDDAFGQPEG